MTFDKSVTAFLRPCAEAIEASVIIQAIYGVFPFSLCLIDVYPGRSRDISVDCCP